MFEMLVVGHRSVQCGDSRHWRVERVERGLMNLRGDFRASTAGAPTFICDNCAAGLFHRRDHGSHVERIQSAQIDYFGVDAGVLENLGGAYRVIYALRISDDSHILTFANHTCLAERYQEVGIFRHLSLYAV